MPSPFTTGSCSHFRSHRMVRTMGDVIVFGKPSKHRKSYFSLKQTRQNVLQSLLRLIKEKRRLEGMMVNTKRQTSIVTSLFFVVFLAVVFFSCSLFRCCFLRLFSCCSLFGCTSFFSSCCSLFLADVFLVGAFLAVVFFVVVLFRCCFLRRSLFGCRFLFLWWCLRLSF